MIDFTPSDVFIAWVLVYEVFIFWATTCENASIYAKSAIFSNPAFAPCFFVFKKLIIAKIMKNLANAVKS